MNRLAIALMAMLLLAPLALADDEPPVPKRKSPKAKSAVPETISVKIENATLADAIKILAVAHKLNVILHPNVDGAVRVTVDAQDMPTLEVLKLLAGAAGAEVELKEGNVFLIRPAVDSPAEPGTTSESQRITIEMNEMPLVMALQTVAKMGNLDVVIDASLVDHPTYRDVDFTGTYKNQSARDILKLLALSNGLKVEERKDGTILIRPGEKRDARAAQQVVQIHSVADLAQDQAAADHIVAEARRMAPGALIRLQGRGSLIVKATYREQETVNDMLMGMRQFAEAQARARDPNHTRLRFFDVKDLIEPYPKLPARMRRLFPDLESVDQKNGVLIVRGTKAQLDAMTLDLDELRRQRPPPNASPERAPLTVEQRIESLRGEVRALRQEVRELRALLQAPVRRTPK